MVSTIVSATLLASIAAAADAKYFETLTGFKWIVRAGDLHPELRFIYGYEEALGYVVGTTVRDKDGIGAALAVLGLAARARAGGESLLEAYDALEVAHGVHLTEQVTVPAQAPVHVMSRLRAAAPQELAGQPITDTSDLTGGTADLPSADVLRYWLPGGRVVIRPSGTEPKIKAYLQIVEPVIAGRLTEARRAARARMDPLVRAVRDVLAELPPSEELGPGHVRGIVALTFAVVGVVAWLAAPAGAGVVPPGATVTVGGHDAFSGVSCTPGMCMAVGTYRSSRSGNRQRGLSELLTSGTWAAKRVPSPARGAFAVQPKDVSCASASMCALVGQHATALGATAQLAEAWNGTAWTIISAVGPPRATWSALNGVSCPTATFCLAVGAARNARRSWATAYAWTSSSTWQPINVPPPPAHDRARDAWLTGVACVTATDCMAVGDYTTATGQLSPYAVQWQSTGSQVLMVPGARDLPRAALRRVSCPSPSQCVAVGTVGPRGTSYAMGDLWILDLWRVVTTTPAPTSFNGVACPSPSLCLAAGFSGRRDLVEVQAWDGIHSTWVTQRTIQTTGAWPFDDFTDVSCATPSDCEAVGSRFDARHNYLTLAEAWNGHTWRLQKTVNP